MYEDDFGFEMDLEYSAQSGELSEQEINDILGIEYATQNDEIQGLVPEIEEEDPSLRRLQKIKTENKKREQAKKEALLNARRVAEEQKRRASVQVQLQSGYAENIRKERETSYSEVISQHTTPSGGIVFGSHAEKYAEQSGEQIRAAEYESGRNNYKTEEPASQTQEPVANTYKREKRGVVLPGEGQQTLSSQIKEPYSEPVVSVEQPVHTAPMRSEASSYTEQPVTRETQKTEANMQSQPSSEAYREPAREQVPVQSGSQYEKSEPVPEQRIAKEEVHTSSAPAPISVPTAEEQAVYTASVSRLEKFVKAESVPASQSEQYRENYSEQYAGSVPVSGTQSNEPVVGNNQSYSTPIRREEIPSASIPAQETYASHSQREEIRESSYVHESYDRPTLFKQKKMESEAVHSSSVQNTPVQSVPTQDASSVQVPIREEYRAESQKSAIEAQREVSHTASQKETSYIQPQTRQETPQSAPVQPTVTIHIPGTQDRVTYGVQEQPKTEPTKVEIPKTESIKAEHPKWESPPIAQSYQSPEYREQTQKEASLASEYASQKQFQSEIQHSEQTRPHASESVRSESQSFDEHQKNDISRESFVESKAETSSRREVETPTVSADTHSQKVAVENSTPISENSSAPRQFTSVEKPNFEEKVVTQGGSVSSQKNENTAEICNNTQETPLPFDTRAINMKKVYAMEPAQSLQEMEVRGTNLVFEHTGNTPTADTAARNTAGSITENGVWVGCDILPTSETAGYSAFNSRKEAEVVQPEAKPAEDLSRMQIDVPKSAIEESSIITRRTSDLKLEDIVAGKTTIPEGAQLREVPQSEMAETVQKVATAGTLYATSADMDKTAERVVLQVYGEKPSIISGESEVQSVSSVKEASSLLNKTPEGTIARHSEVVSEAAQRYFEITKTMNASSLVSSECATPVISVNLQKGGSVEDTFRETVYSMANTLKIAKVSGLVDSDGFVQTASQVAGVSGEMVSFGSGDSKEDRFVRYTEISRDQVAALRGAMELAGIEGSVEDFAKKSGIVIKVVDADSKINYRATNAEGASLEKRNIDISAKEASLIGDKVEAPAKSKEGQVSEEVKEGEVKDYRVIQEAAKRKFARENGQMWKDVCQASQMIIGAALSNLTPEDDAAVETFQRGKNIASSVNSFMCYWGASSAYNMIADRAMTLCDTANTVHDLVTTMNLPREGGAVAGSFSYKLDLKDLSLDKAELREKLQSIEGLSKKEIKNILANAGDIKQMIEARQILLDFSKETGKFSEDVLDFINSKEFFNPTMFSKEFSSAAAKYFSNSKDEMLRTLNPANLSAKEIGKLLKKDAKLKAKGGVGFTEAEVGLLKMFHKQKLTNNKLAKNSHAHGIKSKFKGFLSFAKNTFLKLDDTTVDGLRNIFKVYDSGRTAVSMFKLGSRITTWTAKLSGRIVFMNPLSRAVGRKIKKGVTVVKNTAVTAAKSTKVVKSATKAVKDAKQATKNAKAVVKGVIDRNKQVQKLKSTANKIKSAKDAVGKKAASLNRKRKNISRKIKTGTSKVVRVVGTPSRIIMKPFNAIAKALNKVTDFLKKKILLPVAGAVGVFLLIYTLLVAISAVLIGITGSAERTIMLEPAEVQQLVTNLNAKTEAVYSNAKTTATNSPITDKVLDNTPLYAYGSPKYHGDPTSEYYHNGATIDKTLLNGWHVYYLDSQGNVLGSNVSNVKDIISVACAMMHNTSDDVTEYEHLINDMWDGMVPVITARESDIYHTEYSTDKFPKDGSTYYCTDADFYTKYDAVVAEGVCFYDTVEPRHLTDANDAGYICTGKGCMYNEWDEWVLTCTQSEHTHGSGCNDNDCDNHSSCGEDCCSLTHPHTGSCNEDNCDNHSSCGSDCCDLTEHSHSTNAAPCYRHDYHRDYYCPGHAALHCSYGYRDINVYVTLVLKEDIYKSPITASGITVDYKIPTNYNCTAFEDKQATITFQNHWNGYKKRMKEFLNNGDWDYAQHSAKAVLNPDTGCMECNVPLAKNGTFQTGAEITERCKGTIEWCDRLYNEDWFELYGVAVYSADSGLAVGGSLTPEEKQAIIDDITGQYGDIGTARQAFVDFSLDYVGAIPYWFGGKPSSKSWDSSWGTTAPSSNPYYTYNTGKGRTALGLDCSGFVGWCYWNAFDTQPGCSTSNFTTSLGLSQTSFMNMKPGDIGLSNVPGSPSNHIGIFVGFDENGKALWVHCNGSTANVAVNNYNGFKFYYQLLP